MIKGEGSVTARGNLGVYSILRPEIKERTMSDKRDVFTQLGHAVLDARHNDTPPERVEASRLTLLGKLPPLPPYVTIMTETPWVQVAQIAISPEGKIAVLGIEPDGRKEIVEWQVIDRRWTSRVVDGTDENFRIDYLHYPQGSESVAFTATAPDGKMRLFWGDWRLNLWEEAPGKIVDVKCFDNDRVNRCSVIYQVGEEQTLRLFIRGLRYNGKLYYDPKDIRCHKLSVLGYSDTTEFIVQRFFKNDKTSIVILNGKLETHQYDWIVNGSVMERDGNISFVAYDKDGFIYHVGLAGWDQIRKGYDRIKNATSPEEAVVCLPSGRILIQEREEVDQLILRDVDTNERIKLESVKKIDEIVEIPNGLVIQIIKDDGQCGLLVVHENWDTVPGVLDFFCANQLGNLRHLGDHLVFQTSGRGSESLRAMRIEEIQRWLVENSDDAYTDPIALYPLLTPFERLVPTKEGILGWHFVNGTLYIIRYVL